MKHLMLVLCTILSLVSMSYARASKDRLATPVFRSDGNVREFYRINVGSMSSTRQPWVADENRDRGVVAQNTGPASVAFSSFSFNPAVDNYHLLIASAPYSDFSAGTTLYFRLLPTASSQTINLIHLKDNN
jgi:hypothetical protein